VSPFFDCRFANPHRATDSRASIRHVREKAAALAAAFSTGLTLLRDPGAQHLFELAPPSR